MVSNDDAFCLFKMQLGLQYSSSVLIACYGIIIVVVTILIGL